MTESEQEEKQTSAEPEQETSPQRLICKYCGEGPFPNMSKLGTHSRKCEARKRAEKAQKETKGEPQSPYKEETDVNAILRQILNDHPDITEKIRNEVMNWAELKGVLQPMEVQQILMSMRGMNSQTANIIASKYSYAVYKAQQEGKVILPPAVGGIITGQASQSTFGQIPPAPTPTGSSSILGFPLTFTSQPGQPLQQPPLTTEGVRAIIREELRLKDERPSKEPTEYVDIDDPVRGPRGEVIVDDDGKPIMKHMRMPVNQAAVLIPKEDPELRMLEKMEHYKKIFGSELNEEKVRAIMRENLSPVPSKPETEPMTKDDVARTAADAATNAVKEFASTKGKEELEERRHRELLSAVDRAGSARTVEGYKEDSYRILGQGLSDGTRMLSERKPLEIVIREGIPLLTEGRPPKEVQSGTGESLLDRLQKRGWVAEK